MISPSVARLATGVTLLVALLIIVVSLSDLRCHLVQPGDTTLVLACRASRWEAGR